MLTFTIVFWRCLLFLWASASDGEPQAGSVSHKGLNTTAESAPVSLAASPGDSDLDWVGQSGWEKVHP